MDHESVYHSLVNTFKAELIKRALGATGGNRTHAARLLGLQRTYLLRLIRELGVDVPAGGRNGRGAPAAPTVEARRPDFRIEISGWEPEPRKNGDDGHPRGATAPNPGSPARGRLARQTSEPAGRNR